MVTAKKAPGHELPGGRNPPIVKGGGRELAGRSGAIAGLSTAAPGRSVRQRTKWAYNLSKRAGVRPPICAETYRTRDAFGGSILAVRGTGSAYGVFSKDHAGEERFPARCI